MIEAWESLKFLKKSSHLVVSNLSRFAENEAKRRKGKGVNKEEKKR